MSCVELQEQKPSHSKCSEGDGDGLVMSFVWCLQPYQESPSDGPPMAVEREVAQEKLGEGRWKEKWGTTNGHGATSNEQRPTVANGAIWLRPYVHPCTKRSKWVSLTRLRSIFLLKNIKEVIINKKQVWRIVNHLCCSRNLLTIAYLQRPLSIPPVSYYCPLYHQSQEFIVQPPLPDTSHRRTPLANQHLVVLSAT